MIRALARLADAAVRCFWAWMVYRLVTWLISVRRGVSWEVGIDGHIAPLYPANMDDEDDGLSDFGRDLDGRP